MHNHKATLVYNVLARTVKKNLLYLGENEYKSLSTTSYQTGLSPSNQIQQPMGGPGLSEPGSLDFRTGAWNLVKDGP